MEKYLTQIASTRSTRAHGAQVAGSDASSAEFRWRAACLASVVVGAVLLLAGCGGDYYQVTETSGGKTYYTRSIDHEDGRVQFKDEASGDQVILNNSEIREVTPQQYRNAVGD